LDFVSPFISSAAASRGAPPALFISEAFLNDTDTIYSQVSRNQGVELDSSDWFDTSSLDT
jgi:hypothetical protein